MEKRPKDAKNFVKDEEATQSAGKKSGGADDGQGYDDIIGAFGKYQLMIFMFKILVGVTSAFNNLGVTFFAPTDFVSFWCADSAAITTSTTASPSMLADLSSHHQHHHNITYPLLPKAESYLSNETSGLYGANQAAGLGVHRAPATSGFRAMMGEFMFSEERRHRHSLNMNYDTPIHLRKECYYTSSLDNQRHRCTSYKYDTGIWMSTIIDEWNLVCDRSWFISLTQSLYMSGFILSYLIFGYLSDRFGRWNGLLLGTSIEILSGFGCAFAGSVSSFMFYRFLLGLGNAGRSSSSYLIMIEWTGKYWRMPISTLGSLGWAFGYCLMPWVTLYFLHFRHMQLFVCFYEIIFLIWLLRLPESPRWLLTHRRFDEAYEVLLMAAKFNGLIREDKAAAGEISTSSSIYTTSMPQINGVVNGKPISGVINKQNIDIEMVGNHQQMLDDNLGNVDDDHDDHLEDRPHRLEPYTMLEFDLKFKKLSDTISAKEFTKNENKLSIFDLFKWKNLRKYTLIFSFIWAVNSFVYYGIVLNVGDFGAKNLFVAFTYAGITELPSIAFTIICMKMLPRKTTNVFLFSSIFIMCALQVPLKYYDLQKLQQISMMLAKLFNTCSFTCILYQGIELFPTSIRQTAYSTSSLAGRFGSILAPFIKHLSQKTSNLVPPVIYAALSLIQILLIIKIPETKGSDLPDTLLEAERFRGTDKRASDDEDSLSSRVQITVDTSPAHLSHHQHLRRRSSVSVVPSSDPLGSAK